MDKRINNGGHSTRTFGFDRRKNPYKEVLDKALTIEDLSKIIKMLFKKAIKDNDTTASKILLEYYLGRPKETIEIQQNHKILQISFNEGREVEIIAPSETINAGNNL